MVVKAGVGTRPVSILRHTAVQIALLSGMVIVSVALNVYLVTGKRRRR